MTTLHGQMPMEIEDQTYTCPFCQHDILVSNHDTHEARCSRMHNNRPQLPVQQINPQPIQPVGRQEQRDTSGLKITREHSSSSIPYPEEPVDHMRQPQIRRDVRRVADNRLITCATCEKSVREEDLAQHQAYDCHSSDKIPCEYCNKLFPLNQYAMHVDDCPKRHEEEEREERRQRSEQREPEVEEDQDTEHERLQREQFEYYQQQRQQELQRQQQQNARSRSGSRNRSAGRVQNTQNRQSPPQTIEQEHHSGGFMNFLKNLATVALQSRPDVEDSERPVQQTQTQQQRPVQTVSNQGQQPGFISRLLGLQPETPEEAEQRRQQRAEQAEQRRQQRAAQRQREEEERRMFEQQRRERERQLLENLFGGRPSQDMRGRGMPGMSNPQQNVRTVRMGPNGSFIVSYGGSRGSEMGQSPFQGFQPTQRRTMEDEMAEMGPLGILLSMMNGGMPGMRQVNAEDLGNMTQEEQAGLAREVMDSLSVIKYDKEKNKNVPDDAKSCPICIEEFEDGVEVRYLWCMHRFHKACVDKWLENHSNCPVCKTEYPQNDANFA